MLWTYARMKLSLRSRFLQFQSQGGHCAGACMTPLRAPLRQLLWETQRAFPDPLRWLCSLMRHIIKCSDLDSLGSHLICKRDFGRVKQHLFLSQQSLKATPWTTVKSEKYSFPLTDEIWLSSLTSPPPPPPMKKTIGLMSAKAHRKWFLGMKMST